MDSLLLLPTEIITNILGNMSITDLVRIEHTCHLLQSFVLCEINRRIIKQTSNCDEWGILIHLGQVNAKPTRFDPITKKTYFSVIMDPVKIKTMFDHRRPIHCSLLRKRSAQQQQNTASKFHSYNQNDGFIITIEKGMEEGKTLELDSKNDLCNVHAALTRLPTIPNAVKTEEDFLQCDRFTKKTTQVSPQHQPIKSMAPPPLTYTLQITELSLPLSTIAT